jgi:hypothetical protein
VIPWLLAAAASAQDTPNWVYGACDIFAPIAGTAGWASARDAIRTNATTYSAGEFARRRLRGRNYLAMDFHLVAGVTRVPALCTSDSGTRAGDGVYLQPLDLGATNLGIDVPLLTEGPLNSKLEVFYASSVTQSAMGSRALSWSAPLINLYPAFFAPVVGRFAASRGLFTYGVDWIGGAYLKSDIVSVQAGYTGTKGLYVDVTQEKVALFVNAVGTDLSDGLQVADLQYLLGGVEQFDPRNVAAVDPEVGLSTLFYRNLASGGSVVDALSGDAVPVRLRTIHARQEDILRRFDVRSAVQLDGPVRLRELAVGAHSEGWFRRRDLNVSGEEHWAVRAGVVNLPDQPLFGVNGGIKPTLRADYLKQVGDSDTFALRASLRVNDPDLLDLYPFAYNALGANVELTYIGDEF